MLALRYDWRNNSVLFAHNLDEQPREVSFATILRNSAYNLQGAASEVETRTVKVTLVP